MTIERASASRAHLSRRSMLIGSAALTGLGWRPALAQRALPVRRRMHELAPNDPIVETLRDGVRILKSRTRGVTWSTIARIHGSDRGFNRCPHGNWYFLPWHRAYVLMMERIIRDVTKNPAFAMPYWDWTQDRTLPPQLAAETMGGRPNPLYQPERARRIQIRDAVTSQRVMTRILRTRDFELFGSSRPERQNNTNPRWISADGASAQLEAGPHNQIHGIVGGRSGFMSSPRSALDSVFWLHHGNIDRIWALWNRRGNRNSRHRLWLDMTFPQHFLNPDGSPYSQRVRDLLDPAALGYAYDWADTVAVGDPSPQSAIESLFDRIEAGTVALGGPRLFKIENARTGGIDAPLEVALRVPRQVWGQPAAASAPASGGAPPPPRSAAERATDALRSGPGDEPPPPAQVPVPPAAPQPAPMTDRPVVAQFKDLVAPPADAAAIEIYVKSSRGGTPTPDSPNFVGTFALFGGEHLDHGEGHGHGHKRAPAIAVDVSDTLSRMAQSGETVGEEIVFQLKLVTVGDDGSPLTPLKAGIVELAVF